jgi:hypothetical protein
VTDVPRIVSGGQTGVDRAALDAALGAGVTAGGWCPEGRLAEDGPIDRRYPLTELPGGDYLARTRRNVHDSDATVIVHFGELAGGTAATLRFCREAGRPCLLIDGARVEAGAALERLLAFVAALRPRVLNVAGPRASEDGRGYGYARRLMDEAIAAWREAGRG